MEGKDIGRWIYLRPEVCASMKNDVVFILQQ
jgi:hypothetical protein